MSRINHPIEQEELMAYLDGELETDRAAVAVSHLERCEACKRLASDLKGVSEKLREWQVPEAPQAMPAMDAELDELKDKKVELPDRKTRRVQWLRTFLAPPRVWGLAGVAMAMVILVAVLPLGLLRAPRMNSVATFVSAPEEARYAASQPRTQTILQKEASARDELRASKGNGVTFNAYVDSSAFGPQFGSNLGGAQHRESTLPNAPMIIRTALLTLTAKDFDKARTGLEDSLRRHHGYVGELNVGGASGSARTLNAKLRVPADQLDAVMAELKQLGHVDAESQKGEEVTQQYVDLEARIANAIHTEQRLTDILRERTGKLSDVLEVEQQIDSTRGEIERMEAERKSLANQVSFATLDATLNEEYKAAINVVPLSTSTRLRNAAVEGYQAVVEGIITVLLFLASAGPTLLIWFAILFFPVRAIWRKVRKLVAA